MKSLEKVEELLMPAWSCALIHTAYSVECHESDFGIDNFK